MAFSPSTLDFLVENRLRDSRDWYKEHKDQYNLLVLEPLMDFVNSLTPVMLDIDPQFITEPRVDRTISRIYRDTRFSKDKSLYRDNMWVVFMREKKLYGGLPAFYFDLNPNGFSYGMGYYQASTATMEALRRLIIKNDPSFKKAERALRNQDLFVLEGDAYKRSKYPDAPAPLREWLDKKSVSFNCHSTDSDLLFSDGLTEVLAEGYRLLAPVYDFLCYAEGQKKG